MNRIPFDTSVNLQQLHEVEKQHFKGINILDAVTLDIVSKYILNEGGNVNINNINVPNYPSKAKLNSVIKKLVKLKLLKLEDDIVKCGELLTNYDGFMERGDYNYDPFDFEELHVMKHRVYSNDFPKGSGVYFLLNPNMDIIYIGQSVNLRKRIRDSCLNKQATHFKFLFCDKPYLVDTEGYYINKFKPEKNKVIPKFNKDFVKTGKLSETVELRFQEHITKPI